MDREFVSVKSSSPEFKNYVSGEFSRTHRAVPVSNFSRGLEVNQFTFQLIPLKMIEVPAFYRVLLRAIRPEYLVVSLSPLFISSAHIFAYMNLTQIIAIFCAVISFHCAAFLFNDFKDHVRGIDLINPLCGSQVIQKGWIPAFRVRQLAILFFSIGLLSGGYLLFLMPWPLLLLAGLGLFFGLGYSYLPAKLKAIGVGDVFIGITFGPLIMVGVYSSFGAMDFFKIPTLLTSVSLGLMAVTLFQLRQLQQLMKNHDIGSRTLISKLGFDRGKKLIQVELILGFVLVTGLYLAYSYLEFSYLLIFLSLLGFQYFTLFQFVRKSYSPLSSGFRQIRRQVFILYWTLCVCLSSFLISMV